MKLPREKFREIVLQLLHGCEAGTPFSNLIPFVSDTLKVARSVCREAAVVVQDILDKKDAIDEKIIMASTGYKIDRIGRVDRNILRLAIYEVSFKNVDLPLVTSEAKRLVKKFTNQEASSYIHAILMHLQEPKSNQISDQSPEQISIQKEPVVAT